MIREITALSSQTMQRAKTHSRFVDVLDHVADEIRSNKARVTFQLDESTNVSNCMYLLVYCRYIHAAELKKEFLICESLERTNEVTDDQ